MKVTDLIILIGIIIKYNNKITLEKCNDSIEIEQIQQK